MERVKVQQRLWLRTAIAMAALPMVAACDNITPGPTAIGGVIPGGPGVLLGTASVDDTTLPHPSIRVGPVDDGFRVVTLSSLDATEFVEIAVLSDGDELEPFALVSSGDENVIEGLNAGRYRLEVQWNSSAAGANGVSISGTALALSEEFNHANGDVITLRFG